ncbi:MAG TPA: response regulator [Stellaceae bacterium]|nr:response regulator [Stellaceae bacterium]
MASARKAPHPICVLVVEDIAEIREAMVETLQNAGYEAEEAADAGAALALMRRAPPPDLLFTDIVLGRGLNGYELAQRAAELNPALKVLYTTGYAFRAPETQAALPGSRMLLKPYRMGQVLQEIAQLLAGA